MAEHGVEQGENVSLKGMGETKLVRFLKGVWERTGGAACSDQGIWGNEWLFYFIIQSEMGATAYIYKR
jgi:hypothetical protein